MWHAGPGLRHPAARGDASPCGRPGRGSAAPPQAFAPATSTHGYQPTPLTPPVTLKVGTINATADAAIFIAMEKGYFRDEGIEIELQEFATSALMIPPLATGQLDIATGAGAGLPLMPPSARCHCAS